MSRQPPAVSHRLFVRLLEGRTAVRPAQGHRRCPEAGRTAVRPYAVVSHNADAPAPLLAATLPTANPDCRGQGAASSAPTTVASAVGC